MIVDDNPEIHCLLKARLEARGFIERSAEDGEEALAQFKEFKPDVAFLDVKLPRLVELGRATGPLTDDLTIAVFRYSNPCQSTGNAFAATSAA